jgi:hypothetical protein
MRFGTYFLTIIAIFTFLSSGFTQEDVLRPTKVAKATYFDKTLPLTEMTLIVPGERDRSWKDGLVESNYIKEIPIEPQTGKPENFTDPVLQGFFGRNGSRGPNLNFEGVGNLNGVYPPDTDGDVGPDHYFQMINLLFSIFNKNGQLLYGPVDNSTLWDGFIGAWTGTNDGDPIVLYDQLADRWLSSQFAVSTSNGTFWQLIAISETPDPLGAWYRYAWEFDDMNDYPKLSVWNDGYYGTFRMFGSQVRGGVAAFDREKMLVGDPDAEMVYLDLPSSTLEILCADVDGPAPPDDSPCYFVSLSLSAEKLKVYEFDVDWENTANSTFTLQPLITVAPFAYNLSGISQPGTTQKLDDMADRLMFRLQYRNFGGYEAMVTNHTVNVSGHAGIRWYEMRRETGDWYIYQQGTYSPDNAHRWMGSVAMNGNGGIALGYAVSSSTIYPSIRYTGRTADAPLGEMNQQEWEIIAGTSSQTNINRYGDYSMMSVDPLDDSTFWFTQEYMRGGWKTRIASFDFGPLLPPVVFAGNDTVVCETSGFLTRGVANHHTGVLWTSSGTGNFIPNPPIQLSSIYLRSNQDILNGGFTLSLTAFGYEPGSEASDDVYVAIKQIAEAFAGNDTVICYYHVLDVDAKANYYSALVWTTDGDGTFDDPAILDATYTPGPFDIANGSVKLTLTAFSIDPCEEDKSDKMNVTIDACTGIETMVDKQLELNLVPNPAAGVFSVIVPGNNGQLFDIQIYDSFGDTIFTQRNIVKNGDLLKKINLSYHPDGIYFVRIQTGAKVQIGKIIMQDTDR